MELGEMLVIGFEWYIVFLFSTVCHEAAHALAALKLGGRTVFAIAFLVRFPSDLFR